MCWLNKNKSAFLDRRVSHCCEWLIRWVIKYLFIALIIPLLIGSYRNWIFDHMSSLLSGNNSWPPRAKNLQRDESTGRKYYLRPGSIVVTYSLHVRGLTGSNLPERSNKYCLDKIFWLSYHWLLEFPLITLSEE